MPEFDLDKSLEPAVREFSFTGTCVPFHSYIFPVIHQQAPTDRIEDVFREAGRIEREYAPLLNEAWRRERLSRREKALAFLISPRLWLFWFLGHFQRRAP